MHKGHENSIHTITCFILIDDDMVANMLAQMAVKRHFAQPVIHIFTNPADAVNFIAEGEKYNTLPCTVFLDINMPILSGWDVLDKLEKIINAGTTAFNIYIVSSSIDPDDKTRAAQHPLVKGYIEKPLTPQLMQEVFAV
jgi:CheY-like chemotaxis protein